MIRNGIYISKLDTYREATPYTVFDDKDKLLLDINGFNFEQTLKIVEDLKDVLEGKFLFGYEWSGQRVLFESSKQLTTVEDTMFNIEIQEYKTSELYDLLSKRYDFFCQQNNNNILTSIENGFKRIKANNQEFKIEKNRYRLFDNMTQLEFVLLPEDISSSIENFMSEIKVNQDFLNPIARICNP